MKYKELKEMNIKDWDGQPFRAIAIDTDEAEVFDMDVRRLNGIVECKLIVGYIDGHWRNDSDIHWCHVYPIEWNKIQKKRMTNRQLAMWLAKGNGQVKYATGYVSAYHGYAEGIDHEETHEEIKVRKWDSTEWVEPTTDFLVDCL